MRRSLSYKEYHNPGGELIPLNSCTSLKTAEYGGQQLLSALEHSALQAVGVDCVGVGGGQLSKLFCAPSLLSSLSDSLSHALNVLF